MRTFIENYLHFMKNCIRPHYEKLKPLKSGFIENTNFENNRDPCIELVHTNESLQKKNTTKEIEFADQENVQVEISNLAEEERDASDMMQVIKQITLFLNAFFQPVLSSSRSSVANVNVRKKHWKIFKNIKPKNTSLSLVKTLQ